MANKTEYPKTLKEFTDIVMIKKADLIKKARHDPKGHTYKYMTDEWIKDKQKEFKFLMDNDLLDDYKISFYNGIPCISSSDLHERWVMNVPIESLG